MAARAPAAIVTARRAGAEFWAVYRWLLADVARELPLRSLAMAGLSVGAAMLQWASALVLLLYVNARISSGGDLALPVVGEVDPAIGGSDSALVAWGAIALSLVLLAAVSGYGAHALGFDIACRYARRAGGKILAAVESRPGLLGTVDGGAQIDPARSLGLSLQRETMYVLRALVLIMRSVYAGAQIAVAGALVVLIEPLLTLALLSIGSLFLIPLYGVNRRAARASIAYEDANRDAARFTASLAKGVANGESAASSGEAIGEFEQSVVVDRRLGALGGIVLAGYRSRYIVTVFSGIAGVTTVFAFALSGTDDVAGWTTALVYLAGLLMASAGLNAVSVTVTGASRFLPQVRRYAELVSMRAGPESVVEEDLHEL
ncbi:MAG: hypothetical protein WD993_10905 [Thermoleophilaceae bacterium]